jgi:hypothetical protein
MNEALLGPGRKPSRSTQSQPGTTPAGSFPSRKKPGDDQEPFIIPEKKGADAKAGAQPGKAGEPLLIKIEPDSSPVVRPAPNLDPFEFYKSYYRSRDKDRIDPEKLRKMLASLNRLRKPREVHAAILGYLKNQTYHRVALEPWMYQSLALAIKMDNGTDADVKKSLDYAADLAQATHNPNHLVSVADLLFLKGYYERVGSLLDDAMPRIPHRDDPIRMSINLAQKTKDPVRMADSMERLLSLGWPGRDEYLRIEAGNQVDEMIKHLRSENKGSEADVLQKKLEESMARDVLVRLTWDGYADFDIAVLEPYGVTADFATPRTVFGGSVIKNGYGSHPEEMYVCPRGFNGKYTVRVSNIWADPKRPVTRLTLETITHEGTSLEKKETRNLKPGAENPPTVVTLTDGRRKLALPYVDPSAAIMETAIDALKNSKHTAKGKAPVTKDGEVQKAPPPKGAAGAGEKPRAAAPK